MPYDTFFKDTQQAIRAGADVNHRGKAGITLLHYWVNAGRADIAELLLQNGADVNLRDDSEWTALHFAAAHGHSDLVELLVMNGADIHAKATGQNGPVTALDVARNSGHSIITKLLEHHEGR